MSAQLTDEEALNRVASYCSTAEHCRAEINEKLQRWGIAYDTIARILDRLESEKFIDDERFCIHNTANSAAPRNAGSRPPTAGPARFCTTSRSPTTSTRKR